MPKFYVTMVKDCEKCNGTGEGDQGPENNECPACGGDGALSSEVPLEDALRELGILDRLAALESAVRQVERTAGRAAYNASALANGIYPD